MKLVFAKLQAIHKFWLNQFENDSDSLKAFLIRIASVLFIYVILDRILERITHLPDEYYFDSFIYWSFLKYVSTRWYVVFLLTAIIGAFVLRKNLLTKWTKISKGNSVRLLILLTAGILTWVFTTYNYNLYFDQGHYLDRLLLFVFLLLIYWRPIFVLPFLTILLPIIWQFTAFPGFSFASPFLPIRVLILFSSFYVIFLLLKRFPIADFVFLIGCLVATHYWVSGYGKLNLEWVLNDQLYFLLPATYANGWLGFLDQQTISSIAQNFSYFNFPLKILTLVLEVGSMFFFFHRNTAKFFLGGWVFFHLGIFFISGIFFWVWILIDLVFLYLFLKKDGFSTLPIFNFKYLILSIILIVSGNYWCKPVALAWFDVPVSYTYRFKAETVDGKSYLLPPKFFAPFDYQFTLSAFGYLDEKPLMPVVWGVTDVVNGKAMLKFDSDRTVYSFEKNNGKIYLNERSKHIFDLFIKRYIKNWNKRFSNQTYLSYIEAPRLLWTFPTSTEIEYEKKPIRNIKVIQVLSFYNNHEYSEIRKEIVSEISID